MLSTVAVVAACRPPIRRIASQVSTVASAAAMPAAATVPGEATTMPGKAAMATFPAMPES